MTAYEDDSDFKIYLSDVGLLGAKALRANGIDLRYWKNAYTAELEFVIQDGMSVIPVEVKKGTKVKAISMNFGLGNGIKSIPLYAAFYFAHRSVELSRNIR